MSSNKDQRAGVPRVLLRVVQYRYNGCSSFVGRKELCFWEPRYCRAHWWWLLYSLAITNHPLALVLALYDVLHWQKISRPQSPCGRLLSEEGSSDAAAPAIDGLTNYYLFDASTTREKQIDAGLLAASGKFRLGIVSGTLRSTGRRRRRRLLPPPVAGKRRGRSAPHRRGGDRSSSSSAGGDPLSGPSSRSRVPPPPPPGGRNGDDDDARPPQRPRTRRRLPEQNTERARVRRGHGNRAAGGQESVGGAWQILLACLVACL